MVLAPDVWDSLSQGVGRSSYPTISGPVALLQTGDRSGFFHIQKRKLFSPKLILKSLVSYGTFDLLLL